MRVNGLDHINLRTHDLDRLCAFYTEVLGFEVGDRPTFDAPGVWLYAGGNPILHVSVTDTPASGSTLPVDHYALQVEGFAEAVARLERAGVAYRTVLVPGRPIRQVFILDPDGVMVELNFQTPADVAALG